MFPLIYFSRHGQTDWNAVSRIQGSRDTDINALGQSQATANGKKLKSIIGDGEGFRFVASPMRRTRQTMQNIRTSMGLEPAAFATDDLLREICFGDWQGFRIEEIQQNRPQEFADRLKDKWHYLPSGDDAESYEMLSKRSANWLETVEQKTVCVTHGGWLRTLLHRFGGYSKQDAANSTIPQDKILKLENNQLEWL